MKKLAIFVAAIALTLGLAQCKKEQTPTGETVRITLNVDGGNNGTKANVNPTTNQITFGNGDQILVASGGKYVGTLFKDGEDFSGDVSEDDLVVGLPLYFYFLGNKQDDASLTAGSTTRCTVNISDQTTGLPVISMGRSLKADGSVYEYEAGQTSFTARLYNKCSLMKFNVNLPSNAPEGASTAAVCITGMNNLVTVDFGKATEEGTGLEGSDTYNGFSYSKNPYDGGLIK